MNILNWALLYCLKFSHITVSLLLILELAQKFPCLLFADSLAVSVSFASQTAQYHGLQGTSKRISIPNGKVLGRWLTSPEMLFACCWWNLYFHISFIGWCYYWERRRNDKISSTSIRGKNPDNQGCWGWSLFSDEGCGIDGYVWTN